MCPRSGSGKDRQHVDMILRLDSATKPLLRAHTQFWLVGAKPSLTDLNSVKAALAGVTIGMAPGDGEPTRAFAGLDGPPQVMPGTQGAAYELVSSQVGAARPGASVYYHGLEVGRSPTWTCSAATTSRPRSSCSRPTTGSCARAPCSTTPAPCRSPLSGGSIGAQFAPGNAALGGGVEFDTPRRTCSPDPPRRRARPSRCSPTRATPFPARAAPRCSTASCSPTRSASWRSARP